MSRIVDSAEYHRIDDDIERTKFVWERMKSRCLQYDDPLYRSYGGIGIKVCERWMEFDNFLDDMDICPPEYSLERDDVEGNYEPDNCRWIPWQQQMDNTRKTRRDRDLWNRSR